MKRFKIVNGGHVNLPAEIATQMADAIRLAGGSCDHVVLRPAADEGTMPEGLEEAINTDDETSSLRRRSSGAGF